MNSLETSNYGHIVVLTGAGVSVASGLSTFRGPGGGLAEMLLPVSDGRDLPGNLPDVWQVYGYLRGLCAQTAPNAAHLALAKWQQKWSASRSITLVTQNVDGLHQKAGSESVVEIHGSLGRSRCMNESCPQAKGFDDWDVPDDVPHCSLCGTPLRPDITLFHEALPGDALTTVVSALRQCDLFLAIGTSGTVAPASQFVQGAAQSDARTIFINSTPLEGHNSYFSEQIIGKAEEILPQLLL